MKTDVAVTRPETEETLYVVGESFHGPISDLITDTDLPPMEVLMLSQGWYASVRVSAKPVADALKMNIDAPLHPEPRSGVSVVVEMIDTPNEAEAAQRSTVHDGSEVTTTTKIRTCRKVEGKVGVALVDGKVAIARLLGQFHRWWETHQTERVVADAAARNLLACDDQRGSVMVSTTPRTPTKVWYYAILGFMEQDTDDAETMAEKLAREQGLCYIGGLWPVRNILG